MTTAVKSTTITTSNAFKMGSGETQLEGSIPKMQTQIPKVQMRLMSSDDFRFMIRQMSGISKNGMAIALTMPMV